MTGFPDCETYRFWSRRLCGIACLESALDYWGIDRPNRFCLLQEALRANAYRVKDDGTVEGLVYRPFLKWIESRFGILGEVFEHMSIESAARLLCPGGFLVASVSPEIRRPDACQPRKGGHLVLVFGALNGNITFHNPSGVPPFQQSVHLTYENFSRFFSGRGMVMSF